MKAVLKRVGYLCFTSCLYETNQRVMAMCISYELEVYEMSVII